MKTGLDMVQEMFNYLNVPDITSVITGELYMLVRPQNSNVEDIVINALALTGSQLQQGVINVNIHVPNLSVKINGKPDQTQPDLDRLQKIAKLVVEKLKDYNGDDHRFSAQTGGIPYKDEDNTHFFNIRVNYYAFQNNFVNI